MKPYNKEHKHEEQDKSMKAICLALLAALLFGICSPVSKLLLEELSPTLMASLLYLGAGIGMLVIQLAKTAGKHSMREAKMTRKELPYIIGMVILDIAAPILLMAGLTLTTASTVSLLTNFEIVATSAIAMFFFKEPLDKRMWLAILLITFSCILLSAKDIGRFSLSLGSILVVGACLCWGLENNCTRMLSLKDPLQIVIVKGFGSGIGALVIAVWVNGLYGTLPFIALALLLGFVSYGLSIFFYITAQRELGAARTSVYYAAAPFIGVLVSWIILRDEITGSFLTALAVMLAGSYFAITEKHRHLHIHVEETHEHRHRHDDGHHNHHHDGEYTVEHSHEHTHEPMEHTHSHSPELHHRHDH